MLFCTWKPGGVCTATLASAAFTQAPKLLLAGLKAQSASKSLTPPLTATLLGSTVLSGVVRSTNALNSIAGMCVWLPAAPSEPMKGNWLDSVHTSRVNPVDGVS